MAGTMTKLIHVVVCLWNDRSLRFWVLLLSGVLSVTSAPAFDASALMQEILIPADAAVGTIIYRLRASDPTFDYPLTFTLRERPTTVSVDSLNCTRLNSLCQSNVVLRKRLEPGRFYDFTIDVRSQRGDSVSLNCSFRATNATTPIADIFPGAPTLLMVSENARRNTELGVIIAKGNAARPKGVLLELWGSTLFGLHQKLITEKDAQGTILLLGKLDYEKRTVHHLAVLANDPYTDMATDTRNIASWPLLVAVLDEQDTPPIFTLAPPTTTLSPSLRPGDVVLRVHAEDGDRGKPRDVRYGLVPEGNPFTPFFNISEDTGELRLVKPLSEILSISHTGQPILLTVIAEEVRANPQEPPAQSSTVRLALLPPTVTAGSPTFGANEYNTLLDENSPTGTVLDLPQAEIITQPGDVVTLNLLNDNGTFDIGPSVVEGHSSFQITVHNPKLLDYELWHSVHCYIVAKELSGNYTAKAKLTVLLNDVNDNAPVFSQEEYNGSVQENAKLGTTVLRVEAVDVDREPGSIVRYTNLKGAGSNLFNLDPVSGLITVSNSRELDAEVSSKLSLIVEAADESGKGRTTTATVNIDVIDVNDQIPMFEKNIYEFILNNDRNAFTTDAYIKAIDKDISPPNNEVHYELITPVDNLYIDEKTGELRVIKPWTRSDVFVVRARAWDGGVPRLSSEVDIRIYPPEGQSRKMVFIVPGSNPDRETVQSTLRALTGGRVTIEEIKPYTGYEPDATDVSQDNTAERSVVVATISYSKGAVVDVNRIHNILDKEHSSNVQKTETKTAGQQSGGFSLLWLLILLILLALIAALILILCCICQGCPLYVPPKRRKVASAEIQKLVKGSGHGKESKSVQVAEWFGRREAWTPEQVLVDNEADSLRRHEMERGSDRAEPRRPLQRQQHIQREPSRDQLYIREGNTDILRLITRGGEQQRPVTLMADQAFLVDSGKDILMRRYINQQQSEAAKSQIFLPNAVNKLQSEHEILEASLRQQNALLRQILLDRERDLRLETQSLPAGTQTDQDAGTQTEPELLRPPRRRVRSDNDASEGSDDDDYHIIRARTRRRHSRRGDKSHIRSKIKTPIMEESEVEVAEKPQKVRRNSKTALIKQTRTSELRQQRATSEIKSRSSRSAIRKEVLKEISASLNSNSDDNHPQPEEYYSEDSLEDVSPQSDKTRDSSGRQRYHSESDLRLVSSQSQSQSQTKQSLKSLSQSHSDLSKIKSKDSSTVTDVTKKKPAKRTSRYMEWYNKKNPQPAVSATAKRKRPEPKTKKPKAPEKTEAKEDEVAKEMVSRLTKDTESSSRKKVDSKKAGAGPDHPLLQHSEHRFEAQYPIVRRPEEDADSGIALARPPMAQKKSVFTIAYDDIHTNQLRADSSSPPM